jgi:hypothetical protein
VDRNTIEVVSLHARTSDREHWLSRTPAERFEAQELLRQIIYGYGQRPGPGAYSVLSIPLVFRLGTAPTGMVFTTFIVLLSTTTTASSPAVAT